MQPPNVEFDFLRGAQRQRCNNSTTGKLEHQHHNSDMSEQLHLYLRQRSQSLGMTLSEVGRRAGLSRQTLYALSQAPQKLPALQTIVALAEVLDVHPLRLLQALFDESPQARPSVATASPRDQSAFVQDVTFPDGSLVFPGQRFVKVWEVQNMGEVPWSGRYLQCVDDDVVVYNRNGQELVLANPLVPATARIEVPHTEPGQTVHLAVEFTAPTTPGTVLSYWKSKFPDGTLCFPAALGLWVKVRVSSLATCATEMRQSGK
jgi:transcriptional regulator with XRE-family HTH domain